MYDMAVRIKYSIESQNHNVKSKTIENIKEAIEEGLNLLADDETLYILPTYTAMLEVRKILTGKKIL